MPLPQGIANPAGAFGLPLAGTNVGGSIVMSNDGIYLEMVNNSGATRQYGDVVILDTASAGGLNGLNVNTTTTLHDEFVLGVVAQVGGASSDITKFPSGGPILVQIRGVARVNIAANTVAARQMVEPSAAAGVASGVATATAVVTSGTSAAVNLGAIFGVALEAQSAKDTLNTIRCKLCAGV